MTQPSTTTPPADLEAVKRKQQATWASGDYSAIGALIPIISEDLCDAADLRAGSRVLDVAGGSGSTALAAARMFCDVVSLDYVPSLLERGRERAAAEHLPVRFVEGDAEALPFEDASLDGVSLCNIVHHFPNPRKLIAEVRRVLKPGGRFAAIDPNRVNPFMWLYRDRASPFYSPVGVTENERPVLGRQVAELFRAQGFGVQTDYLAGLSYRYVASRRARVLLPVYNAIDNGVFRLPFMKGMRPFVLTAGEKKA